MKKRIKEISDILKAIENLEYSLTEKEMQLLIKKIVGSCCAGMKPLAFYIALTKSLEYYH